MTKKKQVKETDTDKVKNSDTAENKDIASQESKAVDNKKESSKEEPGKSGKTEKEREREPASLNDSDKEASQTVNLEAKLAEMQDRYLRLSAEFDNYRKRTLREKIELTKHAGEDILVSLIPVMDDFERALKLMESAADSVAMKEGIDLIYNKFSDFLKQNGIKEIDSLNSDFNVDLHEAVSKIPVEDESLKGKVVDVVLKGYYLHDKVMRYSKVVVGE